MKNIGKNMIYVIVLFLGLSLFIVNAVADPVADISVAPEEPEHLDMLTFTATVTSDDDIDEVKLIILECKATLCYARTPVPMVLNVSTYQAEHELKHSDATYISYHLEITSGGSTYETEVTNLTLKIVSSNGDTNGDGSDNGKGIPGFEIIVCIAAVFITLILIRKKR